MIFTNSIFLKKYLLTKRTRFLYIYRYHILILHNTTEVYMKVKPLADRILVKIEKSEAKSAGGIIIPDTAQEKTQTGVVCEVGDDTEVIKVKSGQKVMYDKYAGTQVKIDGVEYLILKMSDILAIIE